LLSGTFDDDGEGGGRGLDGGEGICDGIFGCVCLRGAWRDVVVVEDVVTSALVVSSGSSS